MTDYALLFNDQAPLRAVWPETKSRRCWNHRVLNLLDKLPKRRWGEVRKLMRESLQAQTKEECRHQLEVLSQWLRKGNQTAAAETMLRAVEDFLTYYDFPREHWVHLRTTNPIESVFAGTRLRTNIAKRHPNRENALYLVFKLVERLSRHWRRITGPEQCRVVLAGGDFVDGKLVQNVAA